jgi:hypothetical protein
VTELGRDIHHQAPLGEHLQAAGARRRHSPLHRAERDDEHPRAALEAVEPADERAYAL